MTNLSATIKIGCSGAPKEPAPELDKTVTPVTAGDFSALGWPFAGIAAALINHDDAKKREWAATVAGDATAREKAVLDQEEAMAARQKLRDELAALVIGGLRITMDDQPAALELQLGRVIENSPVVRQLVSKVEEQEAVIRMLLGRLGRRVAA